MTEYEFIQEVKRNLRAARKDAGMTMTDVYKSTNLSYPTINKAFKRGDRTNVTLLTLKELCDAMKVSMKSVLDTPALNEQINISNARTSR